MIAIALVYSYDDILDTGEFLSKYLNENKYKVNTQTLDYLNKTTNKVLPRYITDEKKVNDLVESGINFIKEYKEMVLECLPEISFYRI